MIDFDSMKPVVADSPLRVGFVRVYLPDHRCHDVLEDLADEVRRMEPDAITVEHHEDGDPTHWVARMGTRRIDM